jgi:hypothetical protein
MAAGRRPFFSARVVRALDLLLVAWVLAWLVVGVGVGRIVWDVGGIADPIIRNAAGVSDATHGLDSLRSIPLVGGVLGGAVGGVRAPFDKTRQEAQLVKDRIHQIAVAVALLLVVPPTLLALALYLPFRLRWRRDVAAVRAALARDPFDLVLQRYLAVRAVLGLRFDELHALSDDPWQDIATGQAWAIADVELDRLGLARVR